MLGKLLVRYLWTYKWWLLGVLVFQFASAMASLYLPRLNADIIDKGVSTGDTGYIWSRGVFMLAIALGQIIASIIATYFAARAAMSWRVSSSSRAARKACWSANGLLERAAAKRVCVSRSASCCCPPWPAWRAARRRLWRRRGRRWRPIPRRSSTWARRDPAS